MYTERVTNGFTLHQSKIWNVAFVDDGNIMADDISSIQTMTKAMYECLNYLKMEMHPNKLELYARLSNSGRNYSINIGGSEVMAKPQGECFRTLGLITNMQGNSTKQRSTVFNKIVPLVNRIKITNLCPRQVARIVKTCVHPKMLFACEFTKWSATWIEKVELLAKTLVKGGKSHSVEYRRISYMIMLTVVQWD